MTEKRSKQEIIIWDRQNKKDVTEKVYGDRFISALYNTKLGRLITDKALSGKKLSQIYGRYQSSRISRRKIDAFIEQFQVVKSDFETSSHKSFNDFFIRKFKKGKRPFIKDKNKMGAFAEGRYLAFEHISPEQTFPVKGVWLHADDLIGDKNKAKDFIGGPLLIARLCPVDYHRFHYPDAGETLESFRVKGLLHSVNPIALKQRSKIFITNERHVSILETKHFGKLAYIEVGALCVGKIVQTHKESEPFSKGDEKGYFLFGGSTVILIGQAGRWNLDEDLLLKTRQNQETLVRLGEPIATMNLPLP
jgi:phosphatidylserine decarboxylase